MEASIKANRITDFVRLLQCASRFGDDLNISANKDLWELAVTNSSKSAFCLFKLHKAFFCRYKATGTTVEQRRGVKCQLLVKSLLAVLGKTSATGNVERVDFKIHDPDHSLSSRRRGRRQRDDSESNGHTTGDDEEEEEDDVVTGIGAVLVMKLVCKHGVIKRHSLHLAASEFLRAEVDPDTTPSGFLINARTLRDWLEHFHIGLTSSHVTTSGGTTTIRQENQLSWMFSRDEVRVKSWEGGSRELSTEIKVDHDEFDEYEVFNGRVDLTLPMREFRAALALADQLSIRLVIAFSEPTQPLTLTSEAYEDLDREPFEIFAAIATTTCDQFAGVTTASDPPVNGFRSESRSASFNRGLSRERSTTSIGEGEGDGRNVRRRSNSERPGSASRARLSMSTRPTHISNSVPTTTTNHTKSRMTSNDAEQNGNDDRLFLPGGTQNQTSNENENENENGNEVAAEAGPSTSQQPRMSQAEVEQISGLGDLSQVMDAMDDEQHEEEMEELRASQRVLVDDDAESPVVAEEPPAVPAEASQRREPLVDITLEMDETIFPELHDREPAQSQQNEASRANAEVEVAPYVPADAAPDTDAPVPENPPEPETAQPEGPRQLTPPAPIPERPEEPQDDGAEMEVELPATQVDGDETRSNVTGFAQRGFTRLFED